MRSYNKQLLQMEEYSLQFVVFLTIALEKVCLRKRYMQKLMRLFLMLIAISGVVDKEKLIRYFYQTKKMKRKKFILENS